MPINSVPAFCLLPVLAALNAEVCAEEMTTPAVLDPIVVTATRDATQQLDTSESIGVLNADTLDTVAPTHLNEVMTQIPGTWVSRGSGQEHLMAIRSPVLTGSGACGSFLYLEDGIPVRPNGFCNVNQLFELITEQAEQIEVSRGPGSALFGSNAVHGIINVLMPDENSSAADSIGLEASSDDYYRLTGRIGEDGEQTAYRVLFNGTHYRGFRDDSGYDQQKLHAGFFTDIGSGTLSTRLSLTNLNQETAGFITGKDIYKDEDARETNLNPEAFRDVQSARASTSWDNGQTTYSGFVRGSRMTFLQHFLPGQPLEENGQDSLGGMASHLFDLGDGLSVTVGLDTELARMYLKETQDGPVTNSTSAFLIATRPAGKHYDYDVDSWMVAPYFQGEWALSEAATLTLGARMEHTDYDYDNKMLDGNTRDDGTVCGFGGCNYSRPADRSDSFTNVAPKLGLILGIADNQALYLNASQGFRAPQITELYRLQKDQLVTDLDSEEINSVELGWRLRGQKTSADVALFGAKKRHFIFRDADSFNVSDGKTEHYGIEMNNHYAITHWLSADLSATYARHKYAFDRNAALGETIVDGNDVDTAPKTLASARLNWLASPATQVQLEWAHTGAYYLDAANQHRYGGHDLGNLRINHSINKNWSVSTRVTNFADAKYAERADFAFGSYRYFPGLERRYFVGLRYETE